MKRNTIIIVLLALALGAYVYFFEWKDGKERDSEEASKPAFTFKSEDVTAINLTQQGQTIALSTDGKAWAITQPVKTEADQTAVESLISSLAGTTIDRSLVMTPSLQNGAGLAQPAITLEVKLKNGAQHKIALGRKDPTDAGVYSQIDQNPNVLLLPASLLSSAAKTLNDLRAKELTKLLPGDVTSFTVKNQNLTFAAERNGDNKWLVKEPAAKKDQEAETSKPFTLLSTSATAVIDSPDDKTKGLLAKPVIEASFVGKENQTVKFFISAAEGEDVYVRVEGRAEIFKASKSLLESLNFKLTDVVSMPAATQDPSTKSDEKKEAPTEDKK